MSSPARRPRALVIGGSLGGLFAANLLLRQGWEVDVYEQSGMALAGRGAGIIPHPGLFACLRRIGIEIDESFGVDIPERVTFDRNGAAIATLTLPQCLTTWGRLYELLKNAFPAGHYHFGCCFTRLDQDAGGVTAHFASGAQATGDLLIGADGIRSCVRAQLLPDAKPLYAGYVGWRGMADENSISAHVHRELFPRFAFCLPEREQMLGYPVAGFTNSTQPGQRCYNFVWYRPVEESHELQQLCTDIEGRRHDMAIPPPLIRPEVLTATRRAANELLAPQFAEVVRHTRQLFFQAIFDLESPRMMYGRTALLGDAAFVARPHCGMGVSKAAGDAMALFDVLCGADMDIASALAVYETQRSRVGKAAVRHGRDLGAYLQGSSSAAAAGHHTPQAVMREIATQEIT
jgi:2-polyprenyl-6-methoxyphenol hydroxylase-like FAD-dependent oxidoreductase